LSRSRSKIILQELNREFGGSAKAAGETLLGKLNILRETALNLAGAIADVLTPSIAKAVDAAIRWLQICSTVGRSSERTICSSSNTSVTHGSVTVPRSTREPKRSSAVALGSNNPGTSPHRNDTSRHLGPRGIR
jgi:hypothetical protein